MAESDSSKEPVGEAKDPSQAVQVAVHIRPLIAQERIQGCKECISVVCGEPQVQLGSHSFTFDHVYGGGASPPTGIFDQCVRPLVDGLFQGYNATVLAYGQTGSGKTYTMGTGYTVGGSTDGVIPKVMETLFKKIDSLKHNTDIQLRVSFIEILKEEVHDLLDPNPPAIAVKLEPGSVLKAPPGKPPIQIRETGSGDIILAGVAETEVRTLAEMAACLEQGSLCRATGSTNMNSQSSRSHAIFTINVEQRRRWDSYLSGETPLPEDSGEDFLCAKLHLVDLAGSERAKRTKADGNRFKEGVHINRGLLALGNVISALGDDKKRKEGGHVPYRDSKLTRLLQDSLGGNSRTVMIACVSPADSNAEETLNTLKYANRARNIQNKPTVNRDPVAAEMQRMRQQLEVLQAELVCARATSIPEEIQLLKQKLAWLEASNVELRRELQQSSNGCSVLSQQVLSAQVERDRLKLRIDKMRSGAGLTETSEDEAQNEDLLKNYLTRIQELELELQSTRSRTLESNASDLTIDEERLCGNAADGEEDVVAAKELEHCMLQDCLDKELQELDKRLEMKEAEMKAFARPDNVVLKQHFEKKLMELEDEKKSLQKERDTLLRELETLASSSDEHAHKIQETYVHKLKDLEHQITELKKKQENQAQLLRQKQRSDEAAKRLQDEILRMKQQKVQLQNKIKQESEQFRAWKTTREREVLQLRKEGRKNEYEMHKLQALHQRQKMVLQRKTEEAAAATRRLKELLDARKVSSKDNHGISVMGNEKSMQQWLDHELEVVLRVHEVRTAYEKQNEARAAMAKELSQLQEEDQMTNSGAFGPASMSPSARRARIGLIETMLNASSSTLVAMASQLSEAEERERAFTGRARWQHFRSISELRSMLSMVFDTASFARCQLRDKEIENKELREKVKELTESVRQSEARRVESERELRRGKEPAAVVLATASKAGDRSMDEFLGLSQLINAGPYQLRRKVSREFSSCKRGISESSECETDMEIEESDKDWDVNDEKFTTRQKRLKKSSATGRKSSYTGIAIESQPKEDASTPDASDMSSEDSDQRGKTSLVGCCSCSHSSGCKTSRCVCKAGGSQCGPSCSCKASKCANRGLDGAGTSSSGTNDEQPDELAKQGARLLDSAYKEELQTAEKRRPLSDIGNTRVTFTFPKPAKQKRKLQKPTVQLVTTETVIVPVAENETDEASAATNTTTTVAEEPPPLPPPQPSTLSPLRVRNRHRAREEGVKRVGVPPSPRKPGDEKENIR